MTGDPEGRLAVVSLADASLSLSAVWGRSFVHERRRFGHVIDPGSGQPVAGAVLAVVVSPSATDSDALSTALLVRGVSAPEGWAGQEEPAGWLVAGRDGTDGRLVVRSRGITVEARTAG
jgi:thiamine biosynthesis lipoprotein